MKQAIELLAKFGRRIPNPKLMRWLDYTATVLFLGVYVAVAVMLVNWLANG